MVRPFDGFVSLADSASSSSSGRHFRVECLRSFHGAMVRPCRGLSCALAMSFQFGMGLMFPPNDGASTLSVGSVVR
jgi:hypothetical protein